MDRQKHWEQVYTGKPAERLGWYKPHLLTSLAWIEELGLSPHDPIIDVGGGASTMVDDLLEIGYRSLTVLDISERALSSVKARLGKNADLVEWLTGDITAVDLPADHYKLWHDRAVFHFLTETGDQRKYRDQLLKALQAEGDLIIGTFAPEAPPTCSGLPVQRYDRERLQETLGKEFELIKHHQELHVTPGGVDQMYLYCHFRKTVHKAS